MIKELKKNYLKLGLALEKSNKKPFICQDFLIWIWCEKGIEGLEALSCLKERNSTHFVSLEI